MIAYDLEVWEVVTIIIALVVVCIVVVAITIFCVVKKSLEASERLKDPPEMEGKEEK